MRRRKSKSTLPSGAHRHINLRLERWHRYCVYGVCSWLMATGLLWLGAHYFFRPVTEFGEGISPLEPWSMKLHGAGVLAGIFFIGSLMNSHIRRALKARRNLFAGLSVLILLITLIVTGYGLYYIAGENTRPLWSEVHWIIGLLFPLLFILHILLGKSGTASS